MSVKVEKDAMSATKALLARWDRSTNPVLLSAAGQLRQALRADGRNDVAEIERANAIPITPTEDPR